MCHAGFVRLVLQSVNSELNLLQPQFENNGSALKCKQIHIQEKVPSLWLVSNDFANLEEFVCTTGTRPKLVSEAGCFKALGQSCIKKQAWIYTGNHWMVFLTPPDLIARELGSSTNASQSCIMNRGSHMWMPSKEKNSKKTKHDAIFSLPKLISNVKLNQFLCTGLHFRWCGLAFVFMVWAD